MAHILLTLMVCDEAFIAGQLFNTQTHNTVPISAYIIYFVVIFPWFNSV